MDSAEFLLGTVTAVSQENGLRIRLDGQDAAMSKYYKMLNTGADAPGTGDRVVVMKHSGTYIVMGRIGTPNQNSGKVSRSGDTMTGVLKIISATVKMIANSITLGTRPESNKWSASFAFLDSAEKQIGRLMAFHGSNGNAGIQMYGEQPINGTTKYNYLGLYMSDEGAGIVDMNYPAAWRKALGLELDTTPTAGSANVVTSGGIKTALDGKVSDTGDTMTGDLHMLDAAHYMDSDELTIGTRPESNKWSKRIAFRDSARKTFARVQGYQGANGYVGIQLIGEQTVNGANKTNYLGLYMSDDGNSVVDISSAAWRKALGLGTNGALPLTIAQGGTGSTGIAADSTIANIITAASGLSITSADYYAWGKIAMFYIQINVTTATTAGAWHDLGTLKEGKRPPCTTFIQELNKAIVAMYPNGRIVVWGEWPVGKAFELTATYMLP